jgi:hypothetical protein
MQEKTFLSNIEFEVNEEEIRDAFASLNYNKDFCTPIKFIFTDSFANANKQRVPELEFDNVVRTGVNMPIKAGNLLGGIDKLEHTGAMPLGVITNLIKAGKTVKGLGLLWKEERPDEIAYIKECYEKKIPLNLSWELGFRKSSISDDGIEDLLDVIVRATTLVGAPAYESRTPVLSVASKTQENNNPMELTERITELETQLVDRDATIATQTTKMKEMEDEMSGLKTLNTELSEYKNTAEAKIQRETKLTEIKAKFNEAKITKDETYFTEKADMLLAFESAELEFFLQEMVSLGTTSASTNNKDKKVEIPNLTDTGKTKYSPVELGKQLRELKL